MQTRKESLIQRIRNFKVRLYKDGKKRALEIEQIRVEARINVTK